MLAVGFIPRKKYQLFIRHVRDDAKLSSHFRGMNSPATVNLSLGDVSKKLTDNVGFVVVTDLEVSPL